jgi:phosphoribosylformylglycinamidine synthase
MDLKQPGNLLYFVGSTRDELGASHYHLINHLSDGTVPQQVPGALRMMRALHHAMQTDLVESCHDCSEGGLAVALAEMCIAGRLGAEVDTTKIAPQADVALFSESLSRFVVEIEPCNVQAFEAALQGFDYVQIGSVNDNGKLHIAHGKTVVDIPVGDLERAWRGEQPTTVAPALPERHLDNAIANRAAPIRQGRPRVLILHATGSNRDHDAMTACTLAGGEPEIVHMNQ